MVRRGGGGRVGRGGREVEEVRGGSEGRGEREGVEKEVGGGHPDRNKRRRTE